MLKHCIDLDQDGFAHVRVHIRPFSSQTMKLVEFKIDSGANRTTIGSLFLNELGYDDDWIKQGKLFEGDDRPTTALGVPVDDCYRVILPEIQIGEWVGYNWPMLTCLSQQFKFLFGTDSMRFFNWHFEYGRMQCRYELVSGKRMTLFNKLEQSIHAVDEVGDGAPESKGDFYE